MNEGTTVNYLDATYHALENVTAIDELTPAQRDVELRNFREFVRATGHHDYDAAAEAYVERERYRLCG